MTELVMSAISEIDDSVQFNKLQTHNSQFCFGEILVANIKKEALLKVLQKLKNDSALRFAVLTDLFAVDFPARVKRFEIVYSLLSFELNQRIVLKIDLEDQETISSVTEVFSVANWYEREVFDMFGVEFENHPNLHRILTDYGFVGHPLRKDFPLSGYSQVKYDEKLEQVVYEPLDLEQEFRNFDFASPWQGPDYVLPGDEKATKMKNNS
jgi:NADH-quinone oxidoreductase subunit C